MYFVLSLREVSHLKEVSCNLRSDSNYFKFPSLPKTANEGVTSQVPYANVIISISGFLLR